MIIEHSNSYSKPTIVLKKETNVEDYEGKGIEFISHFGNQPIKTKIKKISKLPTLWKESFLLEVDLEKQYQPCDSIGLYIPNLDQDVDNLMTYLGISDRKVKIKRTGMSAFEYMGTVRDFLLTKMDIKVVPKKKAIYSFIKSSQLKNELEYLTSKEGQKAYLRIVSERWTLLDFLSTYLCQPTFEELVEYCDLIKPRYYTMIHQEGNIKVVISINTDKVIYLNNSNKREPSSCHFPTIIQDTSDSLQRNEIHTEVKYVLGHVSEFVLNNFDKTDFHISAIFRTNQMFSNVEENLVCFCTGTGITPAISFYNTLYKNQKVKNMKIIYGYRSKEDNLLNYLDKIDPSVEIKHALSSEGNYVYHYIDSIDKIKEKCTVFICGNMNMQKQVFEELAVRYPEIVKEKRVIFDNWS